MFITRLLWSFTLTSFVADNTAMLHPFVLTAQTFPVRNRAKNAGAKQSVAFRFERSIIDRFRLGNLTVRPRTDLIRRRQRNTDRFVICRQLRFAFVIKSKHILFFRY